MERWIITLKLVLIGFVVFMLVTIPPPAKLAPWSVLLLLIYLSLHMSALLIKKTFGQIVLLVTSIILAIIGALYVSAFFFLLVPLGVIEVFVHWFYQNIVTLIFSILPVLYVPVDIQGYYIMIAIFSWIVFVLNHMLHEHVHEKEKQLDSMRISQDRLKRRISDSDAFLRQSTYMFKLEERNRISQRIHDDVGHTITGALIQMEAAKKMLPVDEQKAEELMSNAIEITQEGISNIHTTLKNLKPSTEQVGINRLKLYVDEFSATHQIQTGFTFQGDMDNVNHIQWKIIQENIQEAFTNALKYAKATYVTVDVTVLNKLIKVEVKDDGVGEEKVTKGLGIMGMEERAASLRGQVLIDGKNGFTVTTLLPIL